MNIGIVLFQNLRYAPFLKLYESLLSSINNVTYEVIYLNRDISLHEVNDDKYIPIDWLGKGTLSAPVYEKVVNFIRFSVYAKRILKNKKYDFIIILTTFPAILLSNYLIKNYDKRYIVDIRDYTHEKFKFYYAIEEKVLKSAALRVISSEGFKYFLPKNEYILCHNLNLEELETTSITYKRKKNEAIVISYIGTISYKHLCKKLIDLVIKDLRFEFHFYGNEANGTEIHDYVEKINNSRIKMMGSFLPEDKPKIYNKSDLVYNCYGSDNLLVKYAISNKFYDGAIFKRPLLVSPGTSMAALSSNFAFPLDLENVTTLNGLYNWYNKIDEKSFIEYTEQVLFNAKNENLFFFKRLQDVIKNS